VGAAVVLVAACGCGQGADAASPAPSTPPAASPSTPPAASPSTPPTTAPAAPAGGDAVQITAPQPDEHLPAGVMGITGTGTAPEGTLLWRITDAGGAVVDDGYTTAGANGEVGDFSIQQSVQPGTCTPCTVRVWVPDDSDGEGSAPASAATRTFFVD
jgi:Immunoglobulin-like domain of bacterial spore germination